MYHILVHLLSIHQDKPSSTDSPNLVGKLCSPVLYQKLWISKNVGHIFRYIKNCGPHFLVYQKVWATFFDNCFFTKKCGPQFLVNLILSKNVESLSIFVGHIYWYTRICGTLKMYGNLYFSTLFVNNFCGPHIPV